jgi:hypothetical protein
MIYRLYYEEQAHPTEVTTFGQRTTAGTHPIGAKVFGAYKVDSLNTTQILGTGQPQYTTQFDGVNVALVGNASN